MSPNDPDEEALFRQALSEAQKRSDLPEGVKTQIAAFGGKGHALTAKDSAKGRAASAATSERRRTSRLRRDFTDEPRWLEFAKQFGVRLPPWGDPVKATIQNRVLRSIGRDWPWYVAETNERRGDFERLNPDWPARAWAGVVLEMHARALDVAARAQEKARP